MEETEGSTLFGSLPDPRIGVALVTNLNFGCNQSSTVDCMLLLILGGRATQLTHSSDDEEDLDFHNFIMIENSFKKLLNIIRGEFFFFM